MMGCPGPDFQGTKRHGVVSQLQYVNVDDVDKHFEQAERAGATILSRPEDKPYGARLYTAEDLEGHQWSFAQQIT
jgi:uncharacterized glyoxalase superfamily protein PhnB